MTKRELASIESNWARDVLSRSAYTMDLLMDLAEEREIDLQEAAIVAAQLMTPSY